jgi:hypothetical protein
MIYSLKTAQNLNSAMVAAGGDFLGSHSSTAFIK